MVNRATEVHRRQQLALRASAVRDLRRVWPSLDPARLDETFPGWFVAVAAIVGANRRTSAALSGRYLRQLRTAARMPGEPPAVTLRPLPSEVLVTSLGSTGPAVIKKATSRGESLNRATDAAFVLSSQSATRHILNAGRETVMASLSGDPRAEGWRRVTSGRECDWCDSLEDIYPPGYGDFQAHDGCACTAEPVYR